MRWGSPGDAPVEVKRHKESDRLGRYRWSAWALRGVTDPAVGDHVPPGPDDIRGHGLEPLPTDPGRPRDQCVEGRLIVVAQRITVLPVPTALVHRNIVPLWTHGRESTHRDVGGNRHRLAAHRCRAAATALGVFI